MFESKFLQTTLTPLLAIIGAIGGIAGTTIGIWNFRLNRKSHKVGAQLRIRRRSYVPVKNDRGERVYAADEQAIIVEVTNKSYFDVSVRQVGLTLKKGDLARTEFKVLPHTYITGRRIESRGTGEFLIEASCMSPTSQSSLFRMLIGTVPESKYARRVFVELDTGERFTGAGDRLSDALRKMEAWAEEHLAAIK
jgi:hypothetical protein